MLTPSGDDTKEGPERVTLNYGLNNDRRSPNGLELSGITQ